MSKIAIGIDLGTTYSCVGVWLNGKVEIIANDMGNRTTPSYVSFSPTEHLVGDPAKNQSSTNPINTVFDVKRLIGRPFSDPHIQSNLSHWPFKVINLGTKPHIEVSYKGETRSFSPEELSSLVLTKMKQIASIYLNEEVTHAVITVPAYFNDEQRSATKIAGQIAGLNVLRIINEPTAAAFAYGLEKTTEPESNILVFDFGGGTMDVTLLTLDEGVFQVRATAGSTNLGGEDLDNRLVEWCKEDFFKKNHIRLYGPKPIQRLRTACERAKRILSSATQTTIDIDSLFNSIDYSVNITRARFEELCMDIFKKTIDPVQQVLSDASIPKEQIDQIVLVGGSTRIPRIKQLIQDFFLGKKLNETVNPDEAVAYGAAIQAAILSDQAQADNKLNSIIMIDVTPLSLGLETIGGIMTNIIDRNSTIPCKKSRIFSTHSDNQTTVDIQIFEGERKFTTDNNLLGTFSLTNITPAPRGLPQIEVTFDIDTNGILNVKASDKSSNKEKNLTITNNRGRFTEEQIAQMIAQAKEFEESDTKKKLNIDAKNELENYVSSVRLSSIEKADLISSESKAILNDLFKEISLYVEEHPFEDKGMYEGKKKELEDVWNPIAVKLYAKGDKL